LPTYYIYMIFRDRRQTVIIFLYRIHPLLFVLLTDCIHSEVWNESSYTRYLIYLITIICHLQLLCHCVFVCARVCVCLCAFMRGITCVGYSNVINKLTEVVNSSYHKKIITLYNRDIRNHIASNPVFTVPSWKSLKWIINFDVLPVKCCASSTRTRMRGTVML